MGRAFVLRPGEGRPIDLGSFRMSVKATQEDTSGSFTLLEADEPANFGPPLHAHRDATEAFYLNARLVTAASSGPGRSSPITRTLRFYRITRDGLNANWQVVDEQGTSGTWLSGGNLELAEIDQDRG